MSSLCVRCILFGLVILAVTSCDLFPSDKEKPQYTFDDLGVEYRLEVCDDSGIMDFEGEVRYKKEFERQPDLSIEEIEIVGTFSKENKEPIECVYMDFPKKRTFKIPVIGEESLEFHLEKIEFTAKDIHSNFLEETIVIKP